MLIVHYGARTIRATIDPATAPIPWDYASRLVGVLWVLAFALLVVRRGAKTAENDYLALILVLLAFQSAPDRTVLADARAYFFYQLLADPTTWVALLTVAGYALLFGKPVSPARRTLFVLTCGVFVASIVSNTFDNASAGLAWGVDTSSGWIRWPIALIGTAMFVMVLLNVAAAAFGTKHEERARLAWVIDVGITRKFPSDVYWNFEKFLVGRDGTVVERFTSDYAPNDPELLGAIENEILAQFSQR